MKYFSVGQQQILFFLAIFILGILYFRFYYHPLPPPSEEIVREFVVEVSGEVPNPGIFIFQNPPTLKEAIEKAGGLKEVALFETASSSEALETGTLITVVKESGIIPPHPPFNKVIPPTPPLVKGGEGGIQQNEIKIKLGRMEANKLLVFSIPLDINRVSAEDLCLIPGIGEFLAREIVAYRERRRGFRSVEDLKNVKGIGKKKYQTSKTFFTVRH
jgi:competence protein ComEA